MALPVVVVVDAHVVLRETVASRQHRHVVVGRLGHIRARLGLERLTERDGGPAVNEPGGCCDTRGREVVQGPSLSAVVPAAPVGDRIEQLAELVRCHVHVRQRREPTAATLGAPRLIRVRAR